MAKATKLPSGAWRTQVCKVINGKKVRKSFTVDPKECGGDSRKAKAQSELQAREWTLQIEYDENNTTVKTALDNYIKDRSKVLSPRTIYDYKRLIPFFDSILDIPIDDIKSSDIQALINEWSVSISCKTIRNRTSFLLSALDYVDCDRKFKLRYPQKAAKKIMSPDVDEVFALLNNASENFKPVIALAAFGSLRQGEIPAIKQEDISYDMNTISIHADFVKTDNGYVYKPFPKTSGSIRTIQLPKFVMDMLPEVEDPNQFIFDMNPNMIGHYYDRLKRKCGLEYNFHSLRHFAASFRSDLQIPTKYIEEVGGWKDGSKVLKQVYDNTLSSSRKKYTQIANNYLEETFKDVCTKKAE